MTTSAISGVGTTFARGDGASSESFATLAEINTIGGPNMSRNFIDVTSLDSSGGYREFIPSFIDPGQLTLNMNFTIGGYGVMYADFTASPQVTNNYQIVLPDSTSTTLDFAAYVQDLPLNISEDKVAMDVTLRITGAVTLTS